ncbi:MAG: glycosyltransferase [Solirubrobacteraceae bacterium]
MWEPPADAVAAPRPPRGGRGRGGYAEDAPIVLVAPSTSQDPDHRLLRAALEGLASLPVRVIATWNRRLPTRPLPVPANVRLVEWLSYSKTMPGCDLVVCHAGHGTVARALSSGCPVLACPVAGDMNENAARLAWAGAGVRLPRRFLSPRPLRLAAERALADASMRLRAREIAAWCSANDPAGRAADLVERLATKPRGQAKPQCSDELTAMSAAFSARRPRLEAHSESNELRGWDSNPQPSD